MHIPNVRYERRGKNMKKINNKKIMDEVVSMIMYTRNIDKANGFKQSIGIIDEEEIAYEQTLNTEGEQLVQ